MKYDVLCKCKKCEWNKIDLFYINIITGKKFYFKIFRFSASWVQQTIICSILFQNFKISLKITNKKNQIIMCKKQIQNKN